jgi:ketosteroid isomerase-like protein
MVNSKEVQYLLDRIAIKDVICLYARGVDRGDMNVIAECFTPDAKLKTPKLTCNNRDEIVAMLPQMGQYRAQTHFMGNQLVEIDGDSAAAETYSLAIHVYDRDGAQQEYVMGIRYLDRLARVDGKWRIRERSIQNDWTKGSSLFAGTKR